MRASRVIATGIVMVAIFLCWFNTGHAGPSLWPSNKGEICLKNLGYGNDTGPGLGEIVRMAVMRTIGNHYIVHGFVIEKSKNKTLFNGNAIVDGDKILMNVSVSGHRGDISNVVEVYGSIGRVELSASDLTGWVVGIDFHCEPPSFPCDFIDYVGSQYLEATPCL